jgi:hypothetical protein
VGIAATVAVRYGCEWGSGRRRDREGRRIWEQDGGPLELLCGFFRAAVGSTGCWRCWGAAVLAGVSPGNGVSAMGRATVNALGLVASRDDLN